MPMSGQERIQALYNANVYGGMVLGQVLMRDLGITGPALYNVENACASGATAVHLACQALRLGKYDTVLVWGVEQLTQLGGGTIPLQRNDYKTELYASQGMTLPTVYAMRGHALSPRAQREPRRSSPASRSRTAPMACATRSPSSARR